MNKFYIGIIAVLIAIILLQRACTKPCPPPIVCKADTVKIYIHDSIIKPVPVSVVKYILGKPQSVPVSASDTLFMPDDNFNGDTEKLLDDYMAIRNYSDTTKTQFGDIISESAVTQNKLKSHKIISHLSIVDSIPAAPVLKPKNQVYIGVSLLGEQKQLLEGIGPVITLKTKHDHLYSVSAHYMAGGNFLFQATTQWKIHL